MTDAAEYDYSIQYREFHDGSPEHREAMVAECITRLAPLVAGVTRTVAVLDIGCGTGFAMEAMRRLGFSRVDGVERDLAQAEGARAAGFEVEHERDLPGFLRDRPTTYGVVLLLDVLEHIPRGDQKAVLETIRWGMKPGGRLVVSVPNANNPVNARWFWDDYTHDGGAFTERSLRFLLLNAGFADVDVMAGVSPERPAWRTLVRRSRWNDWRLWAVRWLWRGVLRAELTHEDVDRLPLDLNLTAVARTN